MPRAEWSRYLAARCDGFIEGEQLGYARGYQACDEEMGALQREAHKVVLLMAKLDPWEAAQRRRRERQTQAAERHAQAAQPWPAEATS